MAGLERALIGPLLLDVQTELCYFSDKDLCDPLVEREVPATTMLAEAGTGPAA